MRWICRDRGEFKEESAFHQNSRVILLKITLFNEGESFSHMIIYLFM